MDLFWRHGYAQVSVPDLSAATGLSTSSVYNAFGSKRDLYLITLDRYHDLTRTHMLDPMSGGHGGLDDIAAFLDRLAAAAADPNAPRGCLITKTIAQFGHIDAEIATRISGYLTDLKVALTAALDRAAISGHLRPVDVPGRADALVGIVIAFNLLTGAEAPKTLTKAVLDGGRAQIR